MLSLQSTSDRQISWKKTRCQTSIGSRANQYRQASKLFGDTKNYVKKNQTVQESYGLEYGPVTIVTT
jgi:hypothetical protein